MKNSEKKRLESALIELANDGIIVTKKVIDMSYMIYQERKNKGSSNYRAYLDTIDDVRIGYARKSKINAAERADQIRSSTARKYFTNWTFMIAVTMLAQLVALVYDAFANFSTSSFIMTQMFFLFLITIEFMIISFAIMKDKNHNINEQFRLYTETQIEAIKYVFMLNLFSAARKIFK